MKWKSALYSVLLACVAFEATHAQSAMSADSLLIGIWKGTSTCHVKNSPCHDEIVVYHIARGYGEDSFDIAGNKIVGGKEVEMGTLSFRFDKATNQLMATSGNNLLTLHLTGNVLEGTLVANGELSRVIKVAKQSSSSAK